MRERIEVLGIPVDRVTMEEAVEIFAGFMADCGPAEASAEGRPAETDTEAGAEGRPAETDTEAGVGGRPCHLIVTPNSEIVVKATEDPELAGIIKEADLVIPDGIGLVYASKILGQPLKERVTGIDFLNHALAWLAERQGSVYLLGSKPGVAEAAGAKMEAAFPGLRVIGTHHGYFGDEEAAAVAAAVRAAGMETETDVETGTAAAQVRATGEGPDLLCVAMGAPRQEKFMATHAGAAGARAAIGVGGSLDVWAGTVKRAPEFYRKHGLEWLYRILKQPSRLKRSAALPLFMLRVLRSKRHTRAT